MRNWFKLGVIILSTALVALAIADDQPAASQTVALTKEKLSSALPDKRPENLRVLSRVPVDTDEAKRVLKQFPLVWSENECQQRLKMICDFFKVEGVSAIAWCYTLRSVNQAKDGVTFEVEIMPTMLKQRQPAAVVNGVLVEQWLLHRSKNTCTCESRKFEGLPGFVVD